MLEKQATNVKVPFIEHWFARLFVTSLPYQTALCAFDGFLTQGPKFLVRFALALMKNNAVSLFVSQSSTAFVDTLRVLLTTTYNIDSLMEATYSIKINSDTLQESLKDHQAKIAAAAAAAAQKAAEEIIPGLTHSQSMHSMSMIHSLSQSMPNVVVPALSHSQSMGHVAVSIQSSQPLTTAEKHMSLNASTSNLIALLNLGDVTPRSTSPLPFNQNPTPSLASSQSNNGPPARLSRQNSSGELMSPRSFMSPRNSVDLTNLPFNFSSGSMQFSPKEAVTPRIVQLERQGSADKISMSSFTGGFQGGTLIKDEEEDEIDEVVITPGLKEFVENLAEHPAVFLDFPDEQLKTENNSITKKKERHRKLIQQEVPKLQELFTQLEKNPLIFMNEAQFWKIYFSLIRKKVGTSLDYREKWSVNPMVDEKCYRQSRKPILYDLAVNKEQTEPYWTYFSPESAQQDLKRFKSHYRKRIPDQFRKVPWVFITDPNIPLPKPDKEPERAHLFDKVSIELSASADMGWGTLSQSPSLASSSSFSSYSIYPEKENTNNIQVQVATPMAITETSLSQSLSKEEPEVQLSSSLPSKQNSSSSVFIGTRQSIYFTVIKYNLFGEDEGLYDMLFSTIPRNLPQRFTFDDYCLSELGIETAKSIFVLLVKKEGNDILFEKPWIAECVCIYLHFLTTDETLACILSLVMKPQFTMFDLFDFNLFSPCLKVLIKQHVEVLVELMTELQVGDDFLDHWFHRMFVGSFPLQTVFHVFDAFIAEGPKVLFRVALAILKIHSLNLLNCTTREEFQDTLDGLAKEMYKSDLLMEVAYSFKFKKAFLLDTMRTIRSTHMPEISEEYLSSHNGIMTKEQFHELLNLVPASHKHSEPVRIFCTYVDGFNLSLLVERCADAHPTILVIKTESGRIFGAYVTVPWEETSTSRGTGEMFLWIIHPYVKKFRWTQADNLFMIVEPKRLVFGGNGLILDDELHNSYSQRSRTYNNDPLAEELDFRCLNAEVYTFKR
eukprot:TRINITY_DN4362_c0_g1_i7.p1 TRINITY_DN4362_c0_g1~~TRINITY_DN4362_c0_g1_i7.p1  ORF type:complete len:1005 (-),score=255.46 TRINITY_DN4362_c0_g1_i7:64-3078(-)